MKHKTKPVTKQLIRKYFGASARVSGFSGHYRVKTRTGGEVVISGKEMKLIYGGEDTYKAMTLLVGECWGSGKAKGSREFMLGAVAHGEAWDVPVQPDYRDKGAAFGRALLFLVILGIGFLFGAGKEPSTLLATVGIASAVFWMMKHSARRQEQVKVETMGFHYPRVHGGARFAKDEDLEKGGLI